MELIYTFLILDKCYQLPAISNNSLDLTVEISPTWQMLADRLCADESIRIFSQSVGERELGNRIAPKIRPLLNSHYFFMDSPSMKIIH